MSPLLDGSLHAHEKPESISLILPTPTITVVLEVVGRAIAAERSSWILATKLANPTGESPNDRGLSRRRAFQAVEAVCPQSGLVLKYVRLREFSLMTCG